MLPLRNLEIFRAVAETGNFTRAAERLYLTQSAVSHAVRELEMQTGTVLLERGTKRANPTAAGALLLAEAAPVLTACGRLERRMGQLERSAPIRLVSCITIAANWLPEILRRFQMQRPETAVQVEVTSAAAALQTLREGRADAVLLEGVRPDGPFRCRPFSKYSLAAFCAPEYPAAQSGTRWTALCIWPAAGRNRSGPVSIPRLCCPRLRPDWESRYCRRSWLRPPLRRDGWFVWKWRACRFPMNC